MAALAVGVTGTVASAATINFSNATCLAVCDDTVTLNPTTGPNAGLQILAQLQVGTIYKLDNPSFVDGNGEAYEARVEVIGLSAPGSTGSPSTNASSINVRGVNEWMHLSFSFAEEGTLSENDTDGTAKSINNVRFINVFDIDSNAGVRSRDDFTDVVGIDYAVAGIGAALENGGFIPGAPSSINSGQTATAAPTTSSSGEDFNYVRLDPEFVPGNSWRNEPNYVPNVGLTEEDFIASYAVGDSLTRFDLVWGSTGTPSTNVRGFEISLDARPRVTTAPVPLPGALPLLLVGMGAFGVMRHRAKRAA